MVPVTLGGHWSIENRCHYTQAWNSDDDRSTIHTGHDPENLTARCRLDIGILKPRIQDSVASLVQRLARNFRLIFHYPRTTGNPRANCPPLLDQAGKGRLNSLPHRSLWV